MAKDASLHAHPSVLETPFQLMALTVTERLQKAGIPATLTKKFGFHVHVPAEWLADALEILFPDSPAGEVFLGAG